MYFVYSRECVRDKALQRIFTARSLTYGHDRRAFPSYSREIFEIPKTEKECQTWQRRRPEKEHCERPIQCAIAILGNGYSGMLEDCVRLVCANLSAVLRTARQMNSTNTHLYAKWLITFRVWLGKVWFAYIHEVCIRAAAAAAIVRIFRSFMSSTGTIFHCLEMDGI